MKATSARERGAVGGAEILVLGFLVLVSGTLLVAHVWAVVDAKFAVSAASRESTRAAVEAEGDSDVAAVAHDAGIGALRGHRPGLEPAFAIEVEDDRATVARCERLSVTVEVTVPGAALPWIGRVLPVTVRSTHSELVDPYRHGLAGEARCAR